MLRFAEEIMLLMLDDKGGKFADVPRLWLHYALAGAVLMDLALERRIDTDPKQLVVIDPSPLGDDLLDPVLARIVRSTETRDSTIGSRKRSDMPAQSASAPSPVSSSAAFCARRMTVSCGCSRRGAIRSSTTGPSGR